MSVAFSTGEHVASVGSIPAHVEAQFPPHTLSSMDKLGFLPLISNIQRFVGMDDKQEAEFDESPCALEIREQLRKLMAEVDESRAAPASNEISHPRKNSDDEAESSARGDLSVSSLGSTILGERTPEALKVLDTHLMFIGFRLVAPLLRESLQQSRWGSPREK